MDALDVNLLDAVQPYLLNPNDSVNPDGRDCYRLTDIDKRQIEAAIKKHGPSALEHVTKGGAMLYLRSTMRFAGEDEMYLRSLFAPETLKLKPWIGTEKIVITSRDSGRRDHSGRSVKIIESNSPFADRFARLPYKSLLSEDDVVIGHRFCATLQSGNSLSVLEQHGRIESLPPAMLPEIITESWQGIWAPYTRSFRSLGIDIDEMKGSMASDIGQVPSDGGDYLRFLLAVKAIGAMDIDFRAKMSLLEEIPYMLGQDGTPFSELKSRAPLSLVQIMETEFEYDDEEEGEDEDA